ncbi:hypothetical protein ACFLSA_06100 [Bacteroidota bacterium]
MNKSISLLLLVIVFTAYIFSGCETTNGDDEIAPELPPKSTFIMDFSDFQNSSTKSLLLDNESLTRFNHGFAALNVFFWNTFITIGMAIPVASFIESFKHEAVLEGTKWWKWSYNFKAAGALHKAELHAKLADSVRWEMYITKENYYTDFLWYYGEMNLEGTEGYWIMSKNPDSAISVLRIDWSREIKDSIANIRYLNIEPDGPENGGYISFELTEANPYDARYTIFNKGKNNLVEIEWNRDTKEGRMKDSLLFKDMEWHCWNENLDDVVCE